MTKSQKPLYRLAPPFILQGVHFDENEPEEHDEPGEDERLVEESDEDDPYLASDSESEAEEVVKSKYHVEDGLFPIQQFKVSPT